MNAIAEWKLRRIHFIMKMLEGKVHNESTQEYEEHVRVNLNHIKCWDRVSNASKLFLFFKLHLLYQLYLYLDLWVREKYGKQCIQNPDGHKANSTRISN